MTRPLYARYAWLALAALLAAGCQRTLITISTPTPIGGVGTPAVERFAVLSEFSGAVETRTSAGADWEPARLQQVLAEGSELRTGPASRATMLLTEGTKLYVAEDSEFTFGLLNPHLDSLLTAIQLKSGLVWVLMNGGALDVETPFGTATARGAYLSVEYFPDNRTVNVTCLEGVCGFGSILVPAGYKLPDAADNTAPQPMSFEDYGVWGLNVPESTQLAYLGTQPGVLETATAPVAATSTGTAAPTSDAPTEAPPPAGTATPLPSTPTPVPPTGTPTTVPPTAPPTAAPPSPTQPVILPTVARPTFTPRPAYAILGQHIVQGGETLFCIGRGYGVSPTDIAAANNMSTAATLRAGQRLAIPDAPWRTISPGPVCATQFPSPYPGLALPTATSAATVTPAGPPLAVSFGILCVGNNCDSREGIYTLRVEALVSGGVAPYQYNPAQVQQLDFPHCTTGTGTVTVTSADNQVVTKTWSYDDPSCR